MVIIVGMDFAVSNICVVKWPVYFGGVALSHVLLGGDEQQMVELRFLLSKWGVTVGQLVFGDDVPTVCDCDAVVLQGNSLAYRETCLGTLPDGPGGAVGPAAPLIFINSEGVSAENLPDDWLVLAEVTADGGNLRLALQKSCVKARRLRGDSVPAVQDSDSLDGDSYLDFLGHELRSPLTAIKTSLEVLEGELGGMEDSRESSSLKMLAIALRNVRRLHKTVDWSQDLLAAGSLSHIPSPREVAMAEMVVRLQGIGEVRVASAVQDLDLETDPEILTTLVGQMARTLEMACPDRPLTISLQEDPNDAQQLNLAVSAADGEHVPASVVNRRAHSVSSDTAAESGSELQRLARFMVMPDLVGGLGAKLQILDSSEDQPTLILSLNLLPETLTSL